ncbi:C1 family peptidase [Lutimonas sp.]|uniref:C1 family peptidase n=1 Tax=Lutimonas sp. TaxID=1872403 RepID=UPI003C791019
MKYLLPFFLVIFFISCDSNYEYDLQGRLIYTIDKDGDPVIENTDDEEYQEQFTFGCDGGFCYGYNSPDAEIAAIDINIDFPIEYDISEFLPEVRSQGTQGSCVAWATGYYMKSFHKNYDDFTNGNLDLGNEISPAYIYNQIKASDCAGGSAIQRSLDTLKSQGAPDWVIMPYDENECDTQPNDAQKLAALPNKIDSYFYLDGNDLLKNTKASLLNNQPVVIAITIDRNYFGARDADGKHIYRKFLKNDGSHAMLVVGYSDEMNAFKVVNSWGKDWGNQGFVWIDYKAWEQANDIDADFKILCEAWVTNDIIIPQPASL